MATATYAKGRSTARSPPWRHFLPTAVALGVGVALTLVAGALAWRSDNDRVHAALAFRANWRADDIQSKLNDLANSTIAAAVFVAAGGSPTSSAFGDFVRDVVPAIGVAPRSIYWAPQVSAAGRTRFEAEASEELRTEVVIRDVAPDGSRQRAPVREAYLPVLYYVPFAQQSSPVGLDLWTASPIIRDTAARARDGGRIAASPPYEFVTTVHEIGFVLLVPVYDGADPPKTIGERRTRFRGLVGSGFFVNSVLQAISRNTPPILGEIYFSRQPPQSDEPATAFAVYTPQEPFKRTNVVFDPTTMPGITISRRIDVVGTPWHVTFHYPPSEVAALRTAAPALWLICGFLLTLGCGGLVFALQARTRTLSGLVAARATDIARLNDELRARIANLEALFQASPMAIIALDREGTVRLWSPAAERIFGISAAEAVGRPHPIVPPEKEWHYRRHFAEVLSGRRVVGIEGKRRCKDGRLIDARFSGAPLRDPAGNAIGAMYTLEDITEEKNVERQFHRALRMEAVGQLTGGLAHDFNNLLAVMIGNLDLLDEQIVDDATKSELVHAAQRAALKGAELTRSLLSFARRQTLQAQTIDLNGTIDAMTELLRRTLGDHITIAFHPHVDLGLVTVDPAQFESAILNLCVNARDAMPDGGTLAIETSNARLDEAYASRDAEVAAGDYVLVAISDTGNGMAPEVAARAFEPFFTTKRAGRGTGLGLSMVYGFVKQSGGHIKLYSEIGHGTTVKIYLPRNDATVTDPEAFVVADAATSSGDEMVLIVDDNANLRQVVLKQLRELGYRTREAENGRAALDILDGGEKVDLLLTDVVMPGGIDGYQLAEAARSRRPKLKVLLTSGFAENADWNGKKRGVGFPLLSKPYRKWDLARKVRDALDLDKVPPP